MLANHDHFWQYRRIANHIQPMYVILARSRGIRRQSEHVRRADLQLGRIWRLHSVYVTWSARVWRVAWWFLAAREKTKTISVTFMIMKSYCSMFDLLTRIWRAEWCLEA